MSRKFYVLMSLVIIVANITCVANASNNTPVVRGETSPTPIIVNEENSYMRPIGSICKFNKSKVRLKRGKKTTLSVSISKAITYKFKLSKKKIIKIVRRNGRKITIKALKKGRVTITAKSPQSPKKAKCRVIVK